MKERIEEVFEALKGLNIQSTPSNVSILHGVFEALRGIYNELGEMENAGKEGPTVDPCGQDND